MNASDDDLARARRPSRATLAALIFLILYAAALLAGLGKFGFVGPDEPRYAQIAREMFVSGDYVSPRLCGLLWFEKPILFYWLAAGFYHVFGVGEFAARLPSAMMGLVSVGFVWFALRRSGWARWGLASALVLATSTLWMGFSYAASTDMGLAGSLCIAILAGFVASTTQGRERLAWVALCGAATALAMLAKGLVGVFLVVVILAIYAYVARRTVLRGWKETLLAVLIFCVVAGLWYVPVTLQNGRVFIDEFFVNHHFKRFLTPKYGHKQPIYFFAFIAFVGVMPWSFFLMTALARLRNLRPRTDERDAALALAWIWFLVPLAFFSISSSKLPSYLLPVFPALAILLGSEVERVWNGERAVSLRNVTLFNALLLTGLGVVGLAMRHRESFFSVVTTVLFEVLLAAGILAVVAVWRGQTKIAVFAPAVAVLAFMAAAVFALPDLSKTESLVEYSKRTLSQMKTGEIAAFYRSGRQYAHVFYLADRFRFFQDGQPIRGMSSGDDVGIDSRSELLQVLRERKRDGQTPTMIVFSSRALPKNKDKSAGEIEAEKRNKDLDPVEELLGDAQISAQIVAQNGKSVALRVGLK